MKVVVGLGNPGEEYQRTRHNVGFLVLEELSRRHSGGQPKSRYHAEVVEVFVGGEKLLLVAPTTYMNNSGRSVAEVVKFYRLDMDNLVVICDDMNLATGRIRLRGAGSAGGQNGLKDIIHHLGSMSFTRLRVGIGRPPGRISATDHVLGRFKSKEQELITHAVQESADCVELWAGQGLEKAMSQVNRKADNEK